MEGAVGYHRGLQITEYPPAVTVLSLVSPKDAIGQRGSRVDIIHAAAVTRRNIIDKDAIDEGGFGAAVIHPAAVINGIVVLEGAMDHHRRDPVIIEPAAVVGIPVFKTEPVQKGIIGAVRASAHALTVKDGNMGPPIPLPSQGFRARESAIEGHARFHDQHR